MKIFQNQKKIFFINCWKQDLWDTLRIVGWKIDNVGLFLLSPYTTVSPELMSFRFGFKFVELTVCCGSMSGIQHFLRADLSYIEIFGHISKSKIDRGAVTVYKYLFRRIQNTWFQPNKFKNMTNNFKIPNLTK